MKVKQLKKWVLSIVDPRYSEKQKQAERIKRRFIYYFDSEYSTQTYDTFSMGVCKLEYKDNTLTVYLRRPGLLIGARGVTIDDVSEHLKCNIRIVEIILIK